MISTSTFFSYFNNGKFLFFLSNSHRHAELPSAPSALAVVVAQTSWGDVVSLVLKRGRGEDIIC